MLMPTVRAMAATVAPPTATGGARPQKPLDRANVQHLDRVRAIYRPSKADALAPGLERFIGQEDFFRRVDGTQAKMQCPPHWPVRFVSLRDLEILEILDDQDIRAG